MITFVIIYCFISQSMQILRRDEKSVKIMGDLQYSALLIDHYITNGRCANLAMSVRFLL